MRGLIVVVAMLVLMGLAVPVFERLQTRVLDQAASSPAPARNDPSGGPGGRGNVDIPRQWDRLEPTPRSGAGADVLTVPTEVTVYRWRDPSGTLHIEQGPPPPGVDAEAIILRGEGPVTAGDDDSPRAEAGRQPGTPPGNPLSVYAPGGVDRLLDRLDQTLEQMRKRNQEVEELKKDL